MLNEKNTKKSLLLKKAMIGMIAASTTLTGCSFDEDFDNSEQVEEVTKQNGSTIVMMNNDDVYCMDSLSGQMFSSNIDKIKKAENEINYTLLNESYTSLNTFLLILIFTLGINHHLILY